MSQRIKKTPVEIKRLQTFSHLSLRFLRAVRCLPSFATVLVGLTVEFTLGRGLALASQITDTGWSSRSASLGAPSAVMTDDPYCVANNPALCALSRKEGPNETRLRLGYGIYLQQARFDEIGAVVVENSTIGDQTLYGSPSVEPPLALGQSLGMSYTFTEYSLKPSFGLSVYTPLQRIAYFDATDGYQPQYVYYHQQRQTPEIQLGGGIALSEKWTLGVGAQLGFSSTTNANVFLQNGTSKSSTLNVTTSFKPQIAPFIGFGFLPSDSHRFGAVLRSALKQEQTVQIQSSARVIGNTSTLDFTVPASGSLGYVPASFSFGYQFLRPRSYSIFTQIEYQAWSMYRASTLSLDQATIDQCVGGCGIQFSPTLSPDSNYRDIVVPKIGAEISSSSIRYRASYVYRPSILASFPTDSGNALDTDEHRFALGLGLDTWIKVDLHASLSVLQQANVSKETPDTIGYPGYFVGGYLWSTGFTLTYEL